jgi:hypothetical protein
VEATQEKMNKENKREHMPSKRALSTWLTSLFYVLFVVYKQRKLAFWSKGGGDMWI